MSDLGYRLVDIDNHYYETDDCFTRHIEAAYAERTVRVVRGDGPLGQVVVDDKPIGFLGDSKPGDRVSPPGALGDVLSGQVDRAEMQRYEQPRTAADFPEFVDRDARLKVLDSQGVEAAVLLPSMAINVEHSTRHDIGLTYASLRSFNRWVEDDWGYGHDGRIFGVPLLSLLDVDLAVEELERLLDRGARLVNLRPGPVYGRSPADPAFDPVWARIHEADIPVTFHICDSGYTELVSSAWGERANPAYYEYTPFQKVVAFMERPMADTLAALILHGLFDRFPRLRVVSVENGGRWVPELLRAMDKAVDWSVRDPGARHAPPSEVFRRHVTVTPFHEEDTGALVDLVGASQVALGSDYPHTEGLGEPMDFARELSRLPAGDVRKIMRDNGAQLLGLATGS